MSTIAAGNTLTTGFVSTSDTTGNLVLSATGNIQFQQNGTILPALSVAPAFTVYRSGNQNITQNTYTKVQFNVETFDTNNNFDSTTNYRFTPTVAGYYQLNGQIQFNTPATLLVIALYKNGVNAQAATLAATLLAGSMVSISSLVSANGSSDYFEIFAYSDNAAPQINSTTNTYFSGFLARGA